MSPLYVCVCVCVCVCVRACACVRGACVFVCAYVPTFVATQLYVQEQPDLDDLPEQAQHQATHTHGHGQFSLRRLLSYHNIRSSGLHFTERGSILFSLSQDYFPVLTCLAFILS